MTWLWQPLLPGAAQLQAGGGSTVSGDGASAGTATATATSAATAASAYASAGTATAAATSVTLIGGAYASAGVATASATSAATAASVFSADGIATVNGVSEVTLEAVGNAAGTSTAIAVGADANAQSALAIGGWSWPVEDEPKKRKKHREPFDGLREEIEAIYRRVTGQEPAPAQVAEAAKDVAAVVAPFVTNERIDWRKALRQQQFKYRLEVAAAAYEQALRQAIEDDEDDWLLLAA